MDKLESATPSNWEQHLTGVGFLFFVLLSASALCNKLLSC